MFKLWRNNEKFARKPAKTTNEKTTPKGWFFVGAVGGIRTLVPLLTTTRFPVVLVMTSSIPLHI